MAGNLVLRYATLHNVDENEMEYPGRLPWSSKNYDIGIGNVGHFTKSNLTRSWHYQNIFL